MVGGHHGQLENRPDQYQSEEGAFMLQARFSFGIRLDYDAAADPSETSGQDWQRAQDTAQISADGICGTFNNDKSSGSMKWPHLPDREEQKTLLVGQRTADEASSVGIELMATHNRLLENGLKAEHESQSRMWGGSRLRDNQLSCFNWTVFSSP